MERITGSRYTGSALIGLCLLWTACSSSTKAPDRGGIDRAIALYVAADYTSAIDALGALAETAQTDEARREIYYYLGRSYLETDDINRAVDAFTAGVAYGDTGACAEYLVLLKPYVEGGLDPVRRSGKVTRGQLAGTLQSVMLDVDAPPASGSTPGPIEGVARRGWMPRLPDGELHSDAVVTRAAFYSIVLRVLADVAVDVRQVIDPDAYRTAIYDNAPITGAEASAVLGRIAEVRTTHGG